MSVLITGGTGVGLAHELISRGEDVVLFDGGLKGKKLPSQITPAGAFYLPTVPPVRMPPLLSEGLFHRGAVPRFAPLSAVPFPSRRRVRISPDGRSW